MCAVTTGSTLGNRLRRNVTKRVKRKMRYGDPRCNWVQFCNSLLNRTTTVCVTSINYTSEVGNMPLTMQIWILYRGQTRRRDKEHPGRIAPSCSSVSTRGLIPQLRLIGEPLVHVFRYSGGFLSFLEHPACSTRKGCVKGMPNVSIFGFEPTRNGWSWLNSAFYPKHLCADASEGAKRFNLCLPLGLG